MSAELTAIIPTFNRCDLLDDTLETLAAQRGVDGRLEIVVIDDGSTDDTAAVVSRHLDAGVPVRYVHQQNSGLNVGRNRGASEAASPWLAYLDDDVLLPPTWAAAVLDAVAAHPGLDAVGGRLLLRFEDHPPEWLTPALHHYLSAYDLGDEPCPVPAGDSPRGANFVLRKTTWEDLGGFHPLMDRKGDSLISNGEVELFHRLEAKGGEVVYWPEAWAYHRVHPARLTKDWFRRRATAQGVGDAILAAGDGSVAARVPKVLREVGRLGRALPILARSAADRRDPINADLWARYCIARARTFADPPEGDVR